MSVNTSYYTEVKFDISFPLSISLGFKLFKFFGNVFFSDRFIVFIGIFNSGALIRIRL